VKKQIRFYEKSHRYKIGKMELMSVTQFLDNFFDPFRPKEVARKLAKFAHNKAQKRGVRYWLNLWKEKAKFGTQIHKEIENYINFGTCPNANELTINAMTSLEQYRAAEVDVQAEVLVYSEKYRLAGTVDCILLYEDEDDKKIHATLIDWKTNNKIRMEGFKGKKAKYPVSHIDDCNYQKYCLQLALYAKLYEDMTGFIVDTSYIVHLRDDNKVETYIVPEKTKENVEEVLRWQEKKIEQLTN